MTQQPHPSIVGPINTPASSPQTPPPRPPGSLTVVSNRLAWERIQVERQRPPPCSQQDQQQGSVPAHGSHPRDRAADLGINQQFGRTPESSSVAGSLRREGGKINTSAGSRSSLPPSAQLFSRRCSRICHNPPPTHTHPSPRQHGL